MMSMDMEIFRAGQQTDSSGHTQDYTDEMLDQIAENYDAARHEAPVVVGHPKTDSPAFGWVKALYRKGASLFAKAELLPEMVDSISQGLYRKRSVAFYPPDAPSNPNPGKWSLRHVGFLGGSPPAVKGLADVKFSENNVLTFTFAAPDEAKAAQEARSKKYDIGIKEGGHLTKPSEWEDVSDDDFLDPVNYRYPCPDADQTRAAAAYWGRPRNRSQYSPEEQAKIGKRLDAKRKQYEIGGAHAEAHISANAKTRGKTMNWTPKEVLKFFFGSEEPAADATVIIGPEEAAEQVKAFALQPKPRTYSEEETRTLADRAAEEARKKAEAEFSERERRTEAARAEQAHKAEVAAYVESRIRDGKFLPAWRRNGLMQFMEALPHQPGHEFEFGEQKAKKTPWMLFKEFLDGLPQAVPLGEAAKREETSSSADAQLRALTAAKLKENSSLTYSEAGLAVQREHPEIAEACRQEMRG
jgi:hypothetical protein